MNVASLADIIANRIGSAPFPVNLESVCLDIQAIASERDIHIPLSIIRALTVQSIRTMIHKSKEETDICIHFEKL